MDIRCSSITARPSRRAPTMRRWAGSSSPGGKVTRRREDGWRSGFRPPTRTCSTRGPEPVTSIRSRGPGAWNHSGHAPARGKKIFFLNRVGACPFKKHLQSRWPRKGGPGTACLKASRDLDLAQIPTPTRVGNFRALSIFPNQLTELLSRERGHTWVFGGAWPPGTHSRLAASTVSCR